MPAKSPSPTPIDPLIQHLLSSKPYDRVGAVKLWEALSTLSRKLLGKNVIEETQLSKDVIDKINVQPTSVSVGGGDDVFVNDNDVIDPNFNDDTPTSPSSDFVNVKWQYVTVSGKHDVSAYVPLRPDAILFGSTLIGKGELNQATSPFRPYTKFNGVELFMPIGGWLRNLCLNTSDAQVNSATVLQPLSDTLKTNLRVSVPPGAAAGVYKNIKVAVRLEQGESFRMNLDANPVAGVTVRHYCIEFAPDDESSMLGWCGTDSAAVVAPLASTTAFCPMCVNNTFLTGSTAQDRSRLRIPFTCTAKNLMIQTTTAQSGTGSLEFTVFKNGVATALKITVAAGGGAGLYFDPTNTASFSVNDYVTVEVKNNATVAGASIAQIVFCLKPTGTRTAIICGNDFADLVAFDTDFFVVPFNNTSVVTNALSRFPLTRKGTLKGVNLSVGKSDDAVGTYETFTATIMLNGVATSLTATFTGQVSPGPLWLNLPGSVGIAQGDTVSLRLNVPTNTDIGGRVYGWSFELEELV